MNNIPHKVTRVCWNSNHWNAPSGLTGKSKSTNSFENQTGFGFEEWNFDFSKVIDGYLYGYVPAAGADRIHKVKVHPMFNLSFYTIHNDKQTNQRYWIGTIYNVEFVSAEKSIEIYEIYKKNKWLQERLNQLKQLDINYQNYVDLFPKNFFNIRYKLKDMQLLENPIPFEHTDPAVSSNYYNFLNFILLPKTTVLNTKPSTQTEHFYRNGYTIEASNFYKLHSIVHNKLIEELNIEFPNSQIQSEFLLENRTRIDIKVHTNTQQHIFYEIKIARNLRDVLRQSLGQLLEYAFTFGKQNIQKLVIVSTFDIKESQYAQERTFLIFLQEQFQIPICYKYIEVYDTLKKPA